jgi:hypothetical protein
MILSPRRCALPYPGPAVAVPEGNRKTIHALIVQGKRSQRNEDVFASVQNLEAVRIDVEVSIRTPSRIQPYVLEFPVFVLTRPASEHIH